MRRPIHSQQPETRLLTFRLDGTPTGVKEVTAVTCVADVASSLNNKYFVLHSALDAGLYHVWLNVGGAGVDPAPALSTGIPVAIAADAADTVVAAAVAAALDAHAAFAASAVSAVVTVTNADDGATTNAAAGNSGFGISVTTQGVTAAISLSSGTDATLAEGSSAAGDYLLTFREAFGRAPIVVATSETSAVIVQIYDITLSSCRIKCFAADGATAKDANLCVSIIGSELTAQT